MSFSALVNHTIKEALPNFKSLKEAIEVGNPDALMAVLSDSVISSTMTITTQLHDFKKSVADRKDEGESTTTRNTRKRVRKTTTKSS
jgi:hypothetical protein